MEMAPAASHNSPCAACKFLRRKCTSECVFAPYFPPEQPSKFATVHRVFGASNIAKILNELPVSDREDAVTSLFYEADARLRDPVYGCVGYISHLQQRLKELHFNLESARRQLSCFVSPPPPIAPNFNANPTPFPQQMIGSGVPPSVPGTMINNNNLQQQQFHNLMQVNEMQQQMGPSSATAQQEMIMRAYDQQLQQLQQEAICRGGSGDGSVTLAGYNNQIGNLQQENHQHHHMGVSPISLAIGREIHNGSSTVAATAVGGNHHDDDEGRFQLFLQQPQQQERAEDQEVAGRSRSNVTGP